VEVEPGEDRRMRVLRLTPKGRRQFARAMPLWEAAQREFDRWLPLASVRDLARRARRLAREERARDGG
jgi:DNA-binding MarR family transcriptional regulator